MEPIILLLSKFELAIPLDNATFLIPSLLQNEEVRQVLSMVYDVPRVRNATFYDPYEDSNPNESISSLSSLTYRPKRRHGGTQYCAAVAHRKVHKEIFLLSTDKCFRRIFVADHIPANFWPRLIARFLSSAGSFHAIIYDNCSPDIHCQNLVQVGDANIGALKCGWSYGKNYIKLCLGEDMLLCVNGLYSYDNFHNKKTKTPISCSANKIQKARIYFDETDVRTLDINDGFEITIHDYAIHSQPTVNSPVHQSEIMSAQILSRVLETIDEVFKDWFEGLSDRGIYSDRYLTHFIPCPFCYDGKPSVDAHDANQSLIQPKKAKHVVGLSVKYCLCQARISDRIKCHNCGELLLKDLAPDLVSFENLHILVMSLCVMN